MSARTKQRQFIAIYGCTRMFSLAIVMYYKTFLLSCLTYMLVCWWRLFLRTWKLMIQRETHSTYFTGLTCRNVKKTNSVWVLCTSGEPRRFINELLNMYKCLGRLLFVFYLEMACMNWITRILAPWWCMAWVPTQTEELCTLLGLVALLCKLSEGPHAGHRIRIFSLLT